MDITHNCGWCGVCAHLEQATGVYEVACETVDYGYGKQTTWKVEAAFTCPKCNRMNVAFWETDLDPGKTWDPLLIEQALEGEEASISWMPIPGIQKDFEHIPEEMASVSKEAWKCYSAQAYRGAVILARAVIEASAKAKGYEKGTLAAKIERMAENRIIREALANHANEIRHFGNEGAHGDLRSPIAPEDAKEVLVLMSEFLNELWQAPTRAELLRLRRLGRAEEKSVRSRDPQRDRNSS